MAKRTKQQPKEQTEQPRWQIESGTHGVYVGSRIVRFDDREAAEAELARVQSFAANARLREVS